jgi:hypothetical protein
MSRKGHKKRRQPGQVLTGQVNFAPGDRLELTPGELLDSGEASAEINGAPATVAGGLPGEEAVAEVIKQFPERVAAKVVEVRRASPDRVAAPCPYYLACTGCQLQHVSYERQLEFKRQRVASWRSGRSLQGQMYCQRCRARGSTDIATMRGSRCVRVGCKRARLAMSTRSPGVSCG